MLSENEKVKAIYMVKNVQTWGNKYPKTQPTNLIILISVVNSKNHILLQNYAKTSTNVCIIHDECLFLYN